MDLIDRIKELATRIPDQIDHIETEEATKNAFIMPFLSSLGYDVFNPMEVMPEFTADIGTKKGEKVDYVIKEDPPFPEDSKNSIDTTQDELEGYNIIKAILRENTDVKRIIMRDTKSYCGILLDDNNRKPICRLHFNYSKKYLGVFNNKNEERIEIESVDDIFKYADRIKATLSEYQDN